MGVSRQLLTLFLEMCVGRGLIRLYFVLWGLMFAFGVATNYKELATHIGFERWTIEKAAERANVIIKTECDNTPSRLECLYPEAIDPNEYVTEVQVEVSVWLFKTAILKAPFYFFILLVTLYWLMKWIVAGFRKK